MKQIIIVNGIEGDIPVTIETPYEEGVENTITECISFLVKDSNVSIEESLGEAVVEGDLTEEVEQDFLDLCTSNGTVIHGVVSIELATDNGIVVTPTETWTV